METYKNKPEIIKTYSTFLRNNSYPNRRKLCFLMDFWLDIFFIAYRNNLELPKNRMDIYGELLGRYSPKTNQNSTEVIVKSNIKLILKSLIHYLPIPYGVLLCGVRKKWDEYYYRITLQKIKRIKWSINNQFKNDFLDDVKKHFNDDLFKQFKLVLSDKFFINPINLKGFPRKLFGSSDNLFKEEYCHLLFVKKELYFIGIQHGGCTIEYAQNRMDEYDQNISDKVMYWGLGKENIKQNRFKVNPDPFGVIKQFYLVEMVKPNVILNEVLGGFEGIFMEAENKRISVFSNKSIGIIKHPRSVEKNYSAYSAAVFISDITVTNQKQSLFIIDVPSQTFMYKVIYENLPFLMYINRDWHKWFTSNYSGFLDYLNEKKVLFYWDQEEEFLSYLKKIKESGKMFISSNNIISKYLESNNKFL